MEVEDVLQRLGKWGLWQVIFYILIGISNGFPAVWHMLAIVFIGGKPEHHCELQDGEVFNETIPLVLEKKEWIRSSCLRYTKNGTFGNETEKCSTWSYDAEIGPTIITEWDLVCDKDYLKDTTQTVMVFGVMVGAMFFSLMSDLFGRKPVYLTSLWSMVVIGTITAFVNNYYLFTTLRFIAGALQQGIILTAFVLACELFPASNRTVVGIAINLFWAVGMMILALLAFLIRQWRWLQLTISLPGALTIVFYWILPESVPWLVANGRYKDAEKIVYKAAKFNKVHLPDKVFTSHESEGMLSEDKTELSKQNGGFLANVKERIRKRKEAKRDAGAQYTVLDVFRHRRLLINALVMCTLWFVNSLVYYGLSLSTASLAGDRYLNFFISGVVEFIAYFITIFVLQFFGRRWPLCVYHIIAGVALFITAFVPEETASGVDLTPLIITFNMIGKFGITGSFGTVFLYAPEIFPTTLRNQAMGVSSVGGRLGNMLAPFSSYVIEKLPWFPGLFFGITSIAAGLLTLILPETHNKPLPQTIEDVDRLSGKTVHPADTVSPPVESMALQDGKPVAADP